MKHKILSALLLLAMLLTMLPMGAFATEPAQIAWSVQDGVLTVSQANIETDIPDYTAAAPAPWTVADAETGYDPLAITEIVIEEGVKTIGENAFAGLDNAEKLTLPKSVTTVGAGALPAPLQALAIKFDDATTISFDGTEAVTLPTEREGYDSSWSGITLRKDLALAEVNIVFTPITYSVTFMADGVAVDTSALDSTFTVEDLSIDVPEVPAKEGYTAAWEAYTLGAADLTVSAVYTPITYYATFMADGETVDTVEFTVETAELAAPAVPAKEGFDGAWESYTLGATDITVNAVYSLATYTVTFKADGKTVGTDIYTIEDRTVTAPTVPAKTGYTAAWETYTLGASDLTVNAKYTPITYYATFKADGKTVGKVPFTVESTSITAPAVPAKEGFDGKWNSYTLGAKNITVNATYTFKSYTASTTASYLNVRKSASTSAAITGGLARGSKVTIVEEKTDSTGAKWGKTSTGGWISLTYVQKIAYVGGTTSGGTTGGSTSGGTSTTTKYTATVSASSLNVRSGPGTNYGVKGALARGASVTFTEQKTVAGIVWCKLTNGGWVSKAYLTNIKAVSTPSTGGSTSGSGTSGGTTSGGSTSGGTTSGGTTDSGFKAYTATVSVSSTLNVRKGAGTGYAVVSYLTNGAKVTVTAESVSGGTTWAKISNGWVSKAYLKNIKLISTSGGSTSGGSTSGTTATKTVRVTASSLNMRSGPGTGYSVVGSLYNGQTAKIVQTNGIWGKTSSGGWICLTYTVDVVTKPSIDIEGEFTNVVSTYTGSHVGSAGRNVNLSLACQAINGTILVPGASFSFNGVVGQRTAAKGYQLAPIIGGSGYSYGGGVCQVASLLFNTALEANFDITERWQHYAPVDYVPRGRDAAINWGSQDLRFVNNSDYVYQIEAYAEGGTVTVKLLTREDVSVADDISLKVVKSGNRYTLNRYYKGELNYTTVSYH